MQKRFGFCTLFKGYIPNAKKSAKNPLRFAPKVPKMEKNMKKCLSFPCVFIFALGLFLLIYKIGNSFDLYHDFKNCPYSSPFK